MNKFISILKIFLGIIFLSTLSGLSYAKVSKIGVLAPMSGPAASDGQSYVQGVTMAVEEINASGGINGHTFEIVVADVKDQSSDSVLNAIEKLLKNQIILPLTRRKVIRVRTFFTFFHKNRLHLRRTMIQYTYIQDKETI